MRLRPLHANPLATTIPALGVLIMAKCDIYPRHYSDDTNDTAHMMHFMGDPAAPLTTLTMSSDGTPHNSDIVTCSAAHTTDKYIKVKDITLHENLSLVSECPSLYC
jgi:hypothetical protein